WMCWNMTNSLRRERAAAAGEGQRAVVPTAAAEGTVTRGLQRVRVRGSVGRATRTRAEAGVHGSGLRDQRLRTGRRCSRTGTLDDDDLLRFFVRFRDGWEVGMSQPNAFTVSPRPHRAGGRRD